MNTIILASTEDCVFPFNVRAKYIKIYLELSNDPDFKYYIYSGEYDAYVDTIDEILSSVRLEANDAWEIVETSV